MRNSGNIEHEGVVVDLDASYVTVEITRSSACSMCGARSLCFAGESEKGLIQVEIKGFALYQKGERVKVIIKRSMGFKALWISYVIPLVILLAILTGLTFAGAGELVAGIAVLCGLALYYFIIWLLRDKLRKEFIFTVEKID